jgi:hypothetical protein
MNEIKMPTHEGRTPSPNYFGLQVESNIDVFASSAAQHIHNNWSPPSSNVRSTAAASPRVIPVDQNPEFEQFRRQSENNKGFALGSFDFGTPSASAAAKGPFFGSTKTPSPPTAVVAPAESKERPNDVRQDSAEDTTKPRSPKRLLSTESVLLIDRPRRNSPASFLDQDGYGHTSELAEFVQDRFPTPSLPPQKSGHVAQITSHHRAETLPSSLNADDKTGGPTMATPQHILNIIESAVDEVLLLDLRVSTQYGKSHLAGALNLCIPTTLLKRVNFSVLKLAETFKADEQRHKFESWRSSKHIIVYDASSSQMKDAATCINTLKKFTADGWTGGSYIIRGGFNEFANKFPTWVTHGPTHSPASGSNPLQLDSDLPSVAPVIGGCPMPVTQNAANPFFGNIRQNMDLIGGVGQMPIKQPASMTKSVEEEVPVWLEGAANEQNNGKIVADRFLQIEKREQKRMQEALSGKVVYDQPGAANDSSKPIQIAGIEKGSKNRYNNIWPYEHTRVKLQGVSEGGCDYVNANHIQAAWSNKRYIATQGPLPATFNVSLILCLVHAMTKSL